MRLGESHMSSQIFLAANQSLDILLSIFRNFFRSQHRVFHFETDDQEPWAILLAKHGINFDRVTQRIKKVPDFVLSDIQRQTKLWKL